QKANPFDLLLKKTERAAAARAPRVIVRQTETGAVEKLQNAGLVDARLLKREANDQPVVRGAIPFPVFFVGADGDVAIDSRARVEDRPYPSLERPQLQLARAPAGLRRRQKRIVLLQPEIEIAVRIEAQDGLAKKTLQAAKKFIDL